MYLFNLYLERFHTWPFPIDPVFGDFDRVMGYSTPQWRAAVYGATRGQWWVTMRRGASSSKWNDSHPVRALTAFRHMIQIRVHARVFMFIY